MGKLHLTIVLVAISAVMLGVYVVEGGRSLPHLLHELF